MTDFQKGFVFCLFWLGTVALGFVGPVVTEGWMLIVGWFSAVCLWLPALWLVLRLFVPESWLEASYQERTPE